MIPHNARMDLNTLLNKKITVPTLTVKNYGPTLKERLQNLKRDQGFERKKKPVAKPAPLSIETLLADTDTH